MKISLLQYRIEAGDLEGNLKRFLALAEAAEGELLIAPELSLTGYAIPDSETSERVLSEVANFSKRTGKSLVLGHPIFKKGKIFNGAYLFRPGSLEVVAEKERLFPGLDPEIGFSAGEGRRVFELKDFSFGTIICYELRFPEISRRLVARGAEVLIVVSQWPEERLSHYRTLLSARAVENQIYVLATNAAGTIAGVKLGGGSLALSPTGEILGEVRDEEGLLTVEIEKKDLSLARNLFNTSTGIAPEPPERKVLPLSELLPEVSRRRSLGHKMVFTNGCFDLLHAGHVSYLYEARKLGDFLVVGLNSDESLRRLKGPERPINPQEQRALVLASLACVDYVVIFEEDTPKALIEALVPDILVKGADWPEDKIVGAAFVKSRGGRVVRLPFRYQVSTSAIVKKIRKSIPR